MYVLCSTSVLNKVFVLSSPGFLFFKINSTSKRLFKTDRCILRLFSLFVNYLDTLIFKAFIWNWEWSSIMFFEKNNSTIQIRFSFLSSPSYVLFFNFLIFIKFKVQNLLIDRWRKCCRRLRSICTARPSSSNVTARFPICRFTTTSKATLTPSTRKFSLDGCAAVHKMGAGHFGHKTFRHQDTSAPTLSRIAGGAVSCRNCPWSKVSRLVVDLMPKL